MKINYVLMYGTPYLKYREFENFENISKFIVNKDIVDYSIFKKLEDKDEVEMIYRDNDIRYLEKENKQLKEKYDKLSKLYERMYNINCKAREYIENFKNIRVYLEYSDLDDYIEYDYDENFKQDILKILRGDSNE